MHLTDKKLTTLAIRTKAKLLSSAIALIIGGVFSLG